ncbi:MAG TPA: sigma-70 family RNA polymerase sigma factor [Kiritimatiellia bacterium]|nr:sigma-70 family RNA polymerase sigma factor [Kiritimatiellia bacterium]HRZ10905.1 sigma-70 family RNA polymerase sigma factor [Kiritimatiellia bacterium]HSA18822.1 sigma-70 family RNA polymerase sigma factor [Kiritimatiellia bacterium]
MSEISPEQLGRLQSGDRRAWDDFFAQHDELIRSVVSWSKWRFSPPTREDMAQGIRLALFKAIESFNEESSVEYYVKRICINRCIDEVRRQIRARQILVPLATGDGQRPEEETARMADRSQDPLRDVINAEVAGQVKRVLEQVDELCRVAIQRFYFAQQSYKQMADELGISINTVGSRLAKCLEKMRKMFSADLFFGEDFRVSNDSGQ